MSDLALAVMMTIKLPKAMVKSQAAWITDFMVDGACKNYLGCSFLSNVSATELGVTMFDEKKLFLT